MSKVKVDISEYNRMVDRLTGKEMDKAMISAVRSGGQIIRRRTIQNFGSGTAFKAFNVYKDRNGSTKRLPLVRLNVNKKTKDAVVDILGDFRAKFFELGTKRRFTKGYRVTGMKRKGARLYLTRSGKPANRGIITGRRYFRKAQDSEESKVLDDMEKRVMRAVIRIGRKK
ncbi:hypothetical protein NXW35_07285 [Parabacteroides distasonis]|uniref:hypothetical protein n=1 Tax=Parabacteroides distasonis TaxID=823 RepID=UPI0021633E78|nr:hypothetical protein [Parabacteroides distasonis]UVQ81055.1 hypothetical protein NXW35_07285 [Parabacteroides distasonis]